MSTLLAVSDVSVGESDSVVEFENYRPDEGLGFTRYLRVGGKRAYELGSSCDTCEFVFERLEDAVEKVSPAGISARFREGIGELDPTLLDTAAAVLPSGRYRALLIELAPELVRPGEDRDYFTHEQLELWGVDPFWNLPHDPRTEYYRGSTLVLGEGRALYEFVVPMFPSSWLDGGTHAAFGARLRHGDRPTALAVAVLDTKQPSDWEGDPAVNKHSCLAHFLLDGHHKVFAASEAGVPLTILSFLAVDQGTASPDEISHALEELRDKAASV